MQYKEKDTVSLSPDPYLNAVIYVGHFADVPVALAEEAARGQQGSGWPGRRLPCGRLAVGSWRASGWQAAGSILFPSVSPAVSSCSHQCRWSALFFTRWSALFFTCWSAQPGCCGLINDVFCPSLPAHTTKAHPPARTSHAACASAHAAARGAPPRRAGPAPAQAPRAPGSGSCRLTPRRRQPRLRGQGHITAVVAGSNYHAV